MTQYRLGQLLLGSAAENHIISVNEKLSQTKCCYSFAIFKSPDLNMEKCKKTREKGIQSLTKEIWCIKHCRC